MERLKRRERRIMERLEEGKEHEEMGKRTIEEKMERLKMSRK